MIECPGLPPLVWQCIYQNLRTQREICNGMCVCKMLKVVLPELLTNVNLASRASITYLPGIARTCLMAPVNHLAQDTAAVSEKQESFYSNQNDNKFLLLCQPFYMFPAISARFTKLGQLKLSQYQADLPYGEHPTYIDFSALSFPHLSELRITNVFSKQRSVVLDEAHYPQLRKLFVEDSERWREVSTLTLQLPHLESLELEGLRMKEANLAASLSSCSHLRYFLGNRLWFTSSWSSKLCLHLPWLEHFKLHQTELDDLVLKAPRLMTLCLSWCRRLDSVTLLPDGQLPLGDLLADAGDTSEMESRSELIVNAYAGVGGAQSGSSVRRCVPCGDKRIDVTVCGPSDFLESESFPALCRDSRVRAVDLQEQEPEGGESDGSEA